MNSNLKRKEEGRGVNLRPIKDLKKGGIRNIRLFGEQGMMIILSKSNEHYLRDVNTFHIYRVR